jgi:hypothetical protein
VLDPRIAAGAFTGSIAGGRALFDLAVSRPVPIPFFGELGSANPVFVTRAAAARRADTIAAEFIGSYTLGAGQFCTKPGLLFVPSDSDIPQLLAKHAGYQAPLLLNERIQTGFTQSLTRLRELPGVSPLMSAPNGPAGSPVQCCSPLPLPPCWPTWVRCLRSASGLLRWSSLMPTSCSWSRSPSSCRASSPSPSSARSATRSRLR